MSESVRAFARGLTVIRAFGAHAPQMTLAEVGRATDLSRATARRLLLTLEDEGYVRRRGDVFSLTPRVLDLGYAFLSSFSVAELAIPSLEALSATVNESSSVAVLEGSDVLYVARVPANRIMTVSIGLGSRFPAYRTSLGRVLLAALPDDDLDAIWAASDRAEPTPHTVSSLDDLRAALTEARTTGWALVDQELEIGVRSVAAPLVTSSGQTVAAINVSTHASRTPRTELIDRVVPALLEAARSINHALANQPG